MEATNNPKVDIGSICGCLRYRSNRIPFNLLICFTSCDSILNSVFIQMYMGVSKNSGSPKWMVYNGKPGTLLKWMIWGYHYFWKPPYIGNISIPTELDSFQVKFLSSQNSPEFQMNYTPENQHGYPKLWFRKGDSFQMWPFLVSMLDF